jgi:TolB-like protein/class 3 adenylate cyclase
MGDPASAAPGAAPSRRLAAIMFTDLVGYSALAHRDEALAIELLDLHRGWVRAILPPHSGREIETVGDAFLIEFPGALAALSCALAIQRRFAEHNAEAPAGRRMQLRIGVHLGDVEHRGDKVVGDGVNIASRIHGMAEPGGICVSEDVQHAVRNRAGFRFESLGTPMLKNIEAKLELFRVLAPQPAPAPSPQPAAAQRRMRGPLAATAGALVAAAVIAAVAVWALRGPPAPAMPSVAVLPFENLSAEPDSAYFTDGLHDTVIGHLARVRNLKVISRTSVMGYRGKSAGLKAIARELDVNHVVEGSVQRAGGRLRVVAQLIETGTDRHVWSSEYDRDLADVFAVQADIARQVATAVHAKLTPQESTQIARVATRNAEAYDLYLRALQAWRRVEIDEAVVRGMLESLERAVALDPEFALAHALLAQAHDSIHWFGGDPSAQREWQRTAAARLPRRDGLPPRGHRRSCAPARGDGAAVCRGLAARASGSRQLAHGARPPADRAGRCRRRASRSGPRARADAGHARRGHRPRAHAGGSRRARHRRRPRPRARAVGGRGQDPRGRGGKRPLAAAQSVFRLAARRRPFPAANRGKPAEA